jgi:hypothetical protein
MAIKPGGMGSLANGEPPPAYADSMAQEIEKQLNQLLVDDLLPPLLMDNSPETRDRRRLFVAIARGVVKHLNDRRHDIKVRRTDDSLVSPTLDIEGL